MSDIININVTQIVDDVQINTFEPPAVDTYISVTKAELDSLISGNLLKTGMMYEVIGVHPSLYGGSTIYLNAVETNKLEPKGVGKFYTPKYKTSAGSGIWTNYLESTISNVVGMFDVDYGDPLISNTGGTGYFIGNPLGGFIVDTNGLWAGSTTITGESSGATATISDIIFPLNYEVGDMTIWGGYHWAYVELGLSPIDNFNLGDGWSKIAYNETDYNISYDEITYNYATNTITSRRDSRFNFVDANINFFAWGNSKVNRNTSNGGYLNNLNFRGTFFFGNTLELSAGFDGNICSVSAQIFFNTLATQSGIVSNTLAIGSSISYNTLAIGSTITSNTLASNSQISSNTLATQSGISYNTFPALTYIQYANLEPTAYIDGISNATELFTTNPKTVFRLPNGTNKMRYYNENNVLVIANLND